MKTIPSFTVDHLRLLRGVYVSRRDRVGKEEITTFDIRMKEPNREPVLDMGALHTIEHLGATFLRNNPVWDQETVYFGPMGCRTGVYAIFTGSLTPEDIEEILREMFAFMAEYRGEIPGATADGCGNYLHHDLPMARWESEKFLKETLSRLKDENKNYPA